MRHPKRITLLALLGACLAVAGCGSDDEGEAIPQESAATLEAQLANVQARIDDGSLGACEDVRGSADSSNTQAVEQVLNGLPGDVDQDLRDALAQGFDRLFELVDQRCQELSKAADGSDTPTETSEPAPDPIITETETETAPPPDTNTTPETTKEPPPTDTVEPPPAPEEPPAEGEGGGALAPDGNEG